MPAARPWLGLGRPIPRADQPNESMRPRLVLIDALRGLALLGMVLFHIVWDLAYLHWPVPDPSRQPGWTAFGHCIAATFLMLSGLGLVLASPRGSWAALGRIGRLAAAAALVTLATGLLFPADTITFGILHCIALSNFLALGLLGAPIPLVLGLAGLLAAAPTLLAGHAFDSPALAWLGLGVVLPRTLDYQPLLPWSAFVLLGLALGRRLRLDRLPQPRGRLTAGLAAAGRRSLLVYLLHQPICLAVLLPLSWALPPPLDLQAFGRSCRQDCVSVGAQPMVCEEACGCVFARLAARQAVRGALSDLRALSQACVAPRSDAPAAADPAPVP